MDNQLKQWMQDCGLSVPQVTKDLGYKSTVMVYDAWHSLRGAPSNKFIARFEHAYGREETANVFPS